MENGENFERLQAMDLVIEGNEDTSVVPRSGPLPEGSRHAGLSREPIYLLIANHEDLEVRPRPRRVVGPEKVTEVENSSRDGS